MLTKKLGFIYCHSDDLAYAHAVINTYAMGVNTTMPIHLARISCPVGAQSLNDCSLGDGWGAVRGCSHALDVGVICGPEASLRPTPMRTLETNLFFV